MPTLAADLAITVRDLPRDAAMHLLAMVAAHFTHYAELERDRFAAMVDEARAVAS